MPAARSTAPPSRRSLRTRAALALAACALVACARAALASPPTPPLELTVRSLPTDPVHGLASFAVTATPLADVDSLVVEVQVPADALLARGRAREVRGHARSRQALTLAYAVRPSRGERRHVYVRARCVAADGTRYTRGADVAILVGPARVEEPVARDLADGAGGIVRAFPGASTAPARVTPGAAPPAPLAGTWIASGTFQYRDREQDATGFTGVEPNRPARDVDVQVVDAGTNAVLATGATDTTGHYSIVVPDASVRSVKARMVEPVVAHARAPRRRAQQRDAARRLRGRRASRGRARPDDERGVWRHGGPARRGRRGVQHLRRGVERHELLRPARGRAPEPARRSSTGSRARPTARSSRRRTTPFACAAPTGYDDTVIGHEHGHFIAHNWSRDNTPGGDPLPGRQRAGLAARVVRGLRHLVGGRGAARVRRGAATRPLHRHRRRAGRGWARLRVRLRDAQHPGARRGERGRGERGTVGHHRRCCDARRDAGHGRRRTRPPHAPTRGR